jgi:hypothetical protein
METIADIDEIHAQAGSDYRTWKFLICLNCYEMG